MRQKIHSTRRLQEQWQAQVQTPVPEQERFLLKQKEVVTGQKQCEPNVKELVKIEKKFKNKFKKQFEK